MSLCIDIELANAVLIQYLARNYLSPWKTTKPTIIEGASIEMRRIQNRSSVPAAAVTMTQLVEHPELGFAFRFRATWFDGKLLSPTAVHVVIERVFDTADHGSHVAVITAINEWLQAVSP